MLGWLKPVRDAKLRSILELLALLGCLLLTVNLSGFTARCGSPFLSVAVTFACLLILPGFVLMSILVPGHSSIWKRIALSLVASFALGVVPAVLLLRLGGNLAAFRAVYTGLIVAVYLVYIARSAQKSGALPVGRRRAFDLTSVLLWVGAALSLALVLGLFVSVARVFHASDRVLEAATVRHFLDASARPGGRFFERSYLVSSTTPVSARENTAVWELLIALIVDVTRLPLEDVYSFYLPPLLIGFTYVATFTLGKAVLGSTQAGLAFCVAQTVYMITDLLHLPDHILTSNSSYGFYLMTKISEDKALLRFVFLPMLQVVYCDYLGWEGKVRDNRWLSALVVGLIAITFIHPLGLVLFGMSFAGYVGLGLLFDRTQITWSKIVPVLVAILVLFAPLLLAKAELTETEDMEYIRDPFAKAWGLKALGRSGLYVVDPYLLTYHPLMLVCLVCAPLLVPSARRSAGARFLLGNVGVMLLAAFNPLASPLVARVVSPMLLWRLTWLFPGLLIAIYLWVHGLGPVRRLAPRWAGTALRALLVLGVVAVSGALPERAAQGIQRLTWFRDHGTSREQRDALLWMREVGTPDSVMLADYDTTRNIPSFVGSLYGLTFRNRPPRVPTADADLERFYAVDRLDAAHLDTIDRHGVEYVMVRGSSQTSRQLAALPSAFVRVYANAVFAIYQAQPGWQQDALVAQMVAAEAAYDAQEYLKAEGLYQEMLRLAPDNAWALYRLGGVYEARGAWSRAAEMYERSIAACESPAFEVYARLGRVYRALGRPEEAIVAFERARHLGADPAQMAALQRMAEGDAYQRDGQLDRALAAYRSVAELRTQKRPSEAAVEHPYVPAGWPTVDLEGLLRPLALAAGQAREPVPVLDVQEAAPAVYRHDLWQDSGLVRSRAVLEGSVEERIFVTEADARLVWFQHPPSRLDLSVYVPLSSLLRFSTALSPEVWQVGKGDGVQFDVYVEEGETRWHLFSDYIDPKNVPADRRWHDREVDLSLWAGRVVTLTFATSAGPNGDVLYDWAGWGEPQIVQPPEYRFLEELTEAEVEGGETGQVRVDALTLDDETRPILFQHPPSRATFRVALPEDARLAFGLGLDPTAWADGRGDGVTYRVSVRQPDAPDKWATIWQRTLDPQNDPEARHWQDVVVDLALYAGQTVDLAFEALPGPNDDAAFDWGGWSSPVLVSFK